MGRPNLSFDEIALVLAALSLGACTKASEPAGVKADQAPTASASAAPPSNAPAVTATAAATVAPEGQGAATVGAAPTASATETPHQPPKREKKPTGQASCGAGTCSADMKKK